MEENNMQKWSKVFPKKEGLYWFYGYRYGKMSCGKKQQPELMLVKVVKGRSNVFMYIASGQFMYETKVECPHFQKVTLPIFPTDLD